MIMVQMCQNVRSRNESLKVNVERSDYSRTPLSLRVADFTELPIESTDLRNFKLFRALTELRLEEFEEICLRILFLPFSDVIFAFYFSVDLLMRKGKLSSDFSLINYIFAIRSSLESSTLRCELYMSLFSISCCFSMASSRISVPYLCNRPSASFLFKRGSERTMHRRATCANLVNISGSICT